MPREQRLVFGEVAELYDQARPSYPRDLVDHLVQLAAPEQGGAPRALDVGCGTGKATVLLTARGVSGVGVEPDPDMAAVARRHLAPFAGWSVVTEDFEDYRPAGRRFDLITCAQAWHWLDPARRFQQAARVLRGGGWLALFWNRTCDDTSEIRREIDGVYAELCPALSPHGPLTAGHPPVGTPPAGCGFEEPEIRVYPWVVNYTTEQWLELAQTHSDHRMLTPPQRTALLDRLAAAIDAHGGAFDHPYQCWLWSARRR